MFWGSFESICAAQSCFKTDLRSGETTKEVIEDDFCTCRRKNMDTIEQSRDCVPAGGDDERKLRDGLKRKLKEAMRKCGRNDNQ